MLHSEGLRIMPLGRWDNSLERQSDRATYFGAGKELGVNARKTCF